MQISFAVLPLYSLVGKRSILPRVGMGLPVAGSQAKPPIVNKICKMLGAKQALFAIEVDDDIPTWIKVNLALRQFLINCSSLCNSLVHDGHQVRIVIWITVLLSYSRYQMSKEAYKNNLIN